jgi:hypothetical protein
MKVRITGIFEVTKQKEIEHYRRRHDEPDYMADLQPGDKIIVANVSRPSADADPLGWEIPLDELPEGSKLGDEFEIEFKPVPKKKGM